MYVPKSAKTDFGILYEGDIILFPIGGNGVVFMIDEDENGEARLHIMRTNETGHKVIIYKADDAIFSVIEVLEKLP